jgi:hypothetical protein
MTYCNILINLLILVLLLLLQHCFDCIYILRSKLVQFHRRTTWSTANIVNLYLSTMITMQLFK